MHSTFPPASIARRAWSPPSSASEGTCATSQTLSPDLRASLVLLATRVVISAASLGLPPPLSSSGASSKIGITIGRPDRCGSKKFIPLALWPLSSQVMDASRFERSIIAASMPRTIRTHSSRPAAYITLSRHWGSDCPFCGSRMIGTIGTALLSASQTSKSMA